MKFTLRKKALMFMLLCFLVNLQILHYFDENPDPKVCGVVVKHYGLTKKESKEDGKVVKEIYYVGFQFPNLYKAEEVSPVQYEDMKEGKRYCFPEYHVYDNMPRIKLLLHIIQVLSVLVIVGCLLVWLGEFAEGKK